MIDICLSSSSLECITWNQSY